VRNPAASYATFIVALHAILSALHGWAHAQLGVILSPFQMIFITVVITLAPFIAVILLWLNRERRETGAWLLLVSMAGSFLFGTYYHYIAISTDHVTHLPSGDTQGLFRWTAALLATTELVGCGFAAWARQAVRKRPL